LSFDYWHVLSPSLLTVCGWTATAKLLIPSFEQCSDQLSLHYDSVIGVRYLDARAQARRRRTNILTALSSYACFLQHYATHPDWVCGWKLSDLTPGPWRCCSVVHQPSNRTGRHTIQRILRRYGAIFRLSCCLSHGIPTIACVYSTNSDYPACSHKDTPSMEYVIISTEYIPRDI